MSRAFSGTAVKEGAFEEIKLSDYLGKWVILVFYPMVCLPLPHSRAALNVADLQDFTCM
jgi:peroxiredoxin